MLNYFKKKLSRNTFNQNRHANKEENNYDPQLPIEQSTAENDFIEIPIVETAPTDTQQVTRGTKERFSGNLKYNLTQLKKRVTSPNLVIEQVFIGTSSPRKIIIAYLKDKANPDLVKEVKNRIRAIRAETIIDSSYIERNIEDSHMSPFPQLEITERPDVTQSALSQGRIAIILADSQEILLAPTTFFDLLDTPEDAFRRWFFASSFFRIARYIMFILAASLPGFYIAFTSYNSELIPTRLLKILLANRGTTAFPIYFEAFVIMGVVEAVRMMMIRMPTQLGSTIALFAGVTFVGAGIAGNLVGIPITIVATLTIISSYGIPNVDLRGSVRIIQFFTMLMSSLLGTFGFAVSFFYIVTHLVTLKSFGIPYMTPLAPLKGKAWGHTILRENTNAMPQDQTYKPKSNLKRSNIKDKKATDKLDPKVLGIVAVVSLLEFEFYTLSKGVVDVAGRDGWLSCLLGGIILVISSIILIRLASYFPQENFFEYTQKVWGKIIGLFITLGYLIFWLVYLSTLLQDTKVVNKFFFLPTTPSLVPLLFLVVVVVWLVSYGLRNVIRLFQVFLPFIFLPLTFLLLLTLRYISMENFLPVLENGILPVLKGAILFVGVMQGLEVILFVAPFISEIKKSYIPMIVALSSFMFLVFSISSGTIAIMGAANIKETLWPGISFISLIELPGFPVERFELLLTLPALLGIFTTYAIYIYLISYTIINCFNIRHRKSVISLIVAVTLGGVYLFPNYAWTIMFRNLLQYVTPLFILIIPLLTLLLVKIRGLGALK